MTDKAWARGKVTATDVAQKVFDAMAARPVLLSSHPQALGSVQVRLEDVVQGRTPAGRVCAQARAGREPESTARGLTCLRRFVQKPCRKRQG